MVSLATFFRRSGIGVVSQDVILRREVSIVD